MKQINLLMCLMLFASGLFATGSVLGQEEASAKDSSKTVTALKYSKPFWPRVRTNVVKPADAEFEQFVRENPNVISLRLYCEKLTDKGIKHLADLRDLERISLYKLSTPLDKVPLNLQLESLLLSQCAIRANDLACLKSLSNLRRVTILFSGAPLDYHKFSPCAFVHLAKIPRIYSLKFYYCDFREPLDEATRKAIASLNGRLKELVFDKHSVNITAEMVPAIAEIKSLERLELGECPYFHPDDFKPLLSLPNLIEYDAEPYSAKDRAVIRASGKIAAHTRTVRKARVEEESRDE